MTNILIFGHKNPDTDTICSAIVYNNLKRLQGMDTEAVRLGELNDETKYALEYFGVSTPRLVESLKEGQHVILVDHNEFQQSANGIENAVIREVIDHHRIANFETAAPLYYRAEPLGCTATILKKIYEEQSVHINKQMAGLIQLMALGVVLVLGLTQMVVFTWDMTLRLVMVRQFVQLPMVLYLEVLMAVQPLVI